MHGPLPVQELSEVFEVLELLFATIASALAAVVLSVLFVSQETRVRQIKLTVIRLTSNRNLDKFFNFRKKILQYKGNAQSCSARVDYLGERVNLF